MLKNVPAVISPELLKILDEMGHGDEIVIADANFPGASHTSRLIRADGISGTEMLKGLLSLLPLDNYVSENFVLMETTNGDPRPVIWDDYSAIAHKMDDHVKMKQIERFAFYERAQKAYAVILTGEKALYANIIIKKGVL